MGAHIRCLLLMLFLIYMPGLIEAGRLYAVIPPLYGIKGKGNNIKYFTTTPEYLKYVQTGFLNKHLFADINNKKFTISQALSILFNNRNYLDDIEVIGDTFAIDPYLLESVLYELAPYIELGSNELINNMAAEKKLAKKTTKKTTKKKVEKVEKVSINEETLDEEEEIELPIMEGSVLGIQNFFIRPEFNAKKIINNLKKKYRFLDAEIKNDIIILKGIVNNRFQTVFINQNFINTCLELIMTIKNNDEYYKLDGETVSIYSLMKIVHSEEPKGINRYKGLGEQNPSQLKVSTLNSEGDRTLVRYTIESAREEIESIRNIESNMYSLLREIKVDKNEIE